MSKAKVILRPHVVQRSVLAHAEQGVDAARAVRASELIADDAAIGPVEQHVRQLADEAAGVADETAAGQVRDAGEAGEVGRLSMARSRSMHHDGVRPDGMHRGRWQQHLLLGAYERDPPGHREAGHPKSGGIENHLVEHAYLLGAVDVHNRPSLEITSSNQCPVLPIDKSR